MKVEHAVLVVILALLAVHINASFGVSAPDCAAAYTINGMSQSSGLVISDELNKIVIKCNEKYTEQGK